MPIIISQFHLWTENRLNNSKSKDETNRLLTGCANGIRNLRHFPFEMFISYRSIYCISKILFFCGDRSSFNKIRHSTKYYTCHSECRKCKRGRKETDTWCDKKNKERKKEKENRFLGIRNLPYFFSKRKQWHFHLINWFAFIDIDEIEIGRLFRIREIYLYDTNKAKQVFEQCSQFLFVYQFNRWCT